MLCHTLFLSPTELIPSATIIRPRVGVVCLCLCLCVSPPSFHVVIKFGVGPSDSGLDNFLSVC